MISNNPNTRTTSAPRTRVWLVYDRDRFIADIEAPTHTAAMDIVAERYGGACGYSAVLARS